MKTVFITFLLLISTLGAVEIDELKLENADLKTCLQKLSEKSGKQLDIKCDLVNDKRHWLFLNSSLNLAVETACNQFGLRYLFTPEKIIIDKHRIPQNDDQKFTIKVSSYFDQYYKNIAQLFNGCSNIEIKENELSFSTGQKEYQAILKSLKILGFADCKREVKVELQLFNSRDPQKSIAVFTAKNGEKIKKSLTESLGSCEFNVFNLNTNSTGEISYSFKFKWQNGSWSQKFSTEANCGELKITDNISARIEPLIYLDGAAVSQGFFHLSQIKENFKFPKSLSQEIPEVRLTESEHEALIPFIAEKAGVPVSLTLCINPTLRDEVDPFNENSEDDDKKITDTFGSLSLDADKIPLGEVIKYYCDHFGLSYKISTEKIELYTSKKSSRVFTGLTESKENVAIYRVPNQIWHRKEAGNQKDKLNKKASNDADLAEQYFQNLGANVKVLATLRNKGFVLVSSRWPIENYFHHISQNFHLYKLVFHDEKEFEKFKFKKHDKGFSDQLALLKPEQISEFEVIKEEGDVSNKKVLLSIADNKLTFYSHEEKSMYNFSLDQPVYLEKRSSNGSITVIFSPGSFEFNDIPFDSDTLKPVTVSKNYRFENSSFEEHLKQTTNLWKDAEGYKLPIYRPSVSATYSTAQSLDNTEDPFAAEADPFAIDDPLSEDQTDMSKNPEEKQEKFSLNLQNTSLADLYSAFAFIYGLRIKFDEHAVILASPQNHMCGEITKFYDFPGSLYQRYPIVKEIKESDGYVRYEILGIPLGAGHSAAYLDSVEKFVVTADFHDHPKIKSLLRLIKRNSSTIKILDNSFLIPGGFSYSSENFSLLTNEQSVSIKKDKGAAISFEKAIRDTEIIQHASNSWLDKLTPAPELKESLSRLKIVSFKVDQPNLNSALFMLSQKCQKLRFSDSAVNLIAPLFKTDKPIKMSFKNQSVLAILESFAKHYNLNVFTASNFTILSPLENPGYQMEARRLSLSKKVQKEQIELPPSDSAQSHGFELRNNGQEILIHGTTPYLDKVEKEFITKGLISVNETLKFQLIKDGQSVFDFNQNVTFSSPVKIMNRWLLEIKREKGQFILNFTEPSGKKLENLKVKKGSTELLRGYSILIE